MKLIKNISLMVLMLMAMVACVEKTPDYGNFPTKDVDFTYNVDGDEFLTDFYVVSKIQFNNTSSKSGAVTWDFGDGETSTEPNPVHKYKKAGVYKVTMSLAGVGERSYPIMIYDIAPVLSVASQSAVPVVINDVTVELSIFLPNPENLKCRYEWTFPEGTAKEDGTAMTTWTGYSHEDGTIDYPGKLKFKNIGSQKIEIKTWFDIDGENRRLEDSYVNVQVGCSYPCKTLYYAQVDGNIKAYKLVDLSRLPEGTKNNPFDMGVKSGSMPQNLVYARYKESNKEEASDFIYILDCGKQYTYVNDAAGNLGDGKITVMNADASVVDLCVTNVGKTAFNDPYQGWADEENLYYTDRNTGIRRVPLATRGQVEPSDYLVQNNWIGYYNKGIAYGAIHVGHYRDKNGMWYWGKSYSGNGIYRFQNADIQEGMDYNKVASPHPVLFSGTNPRSFCIDEKNNRMIVYFRSPADIAGISTYNIPGYDETLDAKTNRIKYVALEADPVNKTADEGVWIPQLALDSATGLVYFGFNAASGFTTYTTGIKVFDPETGKISSVFNNTDKVYGIVVCDTETELF